MSLYIGLMSGTSMDAVDVALVEIKQAKTQLIRFHEHPVPGDLKTKLKEVNSTSPLSKIAKLDVEMGELFAQATLQLLADSNLKSKEICAIGSHGQTVLHAPNEALPHSLQIGDPNIIAARTNITTVADFRRMDIAFGGQGAPLAPIFHVDQFRTDHSRVILNIGGFANITIIPAEGERQISGFDTGPGNALLDDWCKLKRHKDYDENGDWAASGKVNKELLARCLEDAYFSTDAPKSTGRDEFNLSWIQQKSIGSITDEDVQATLLALTVETISNAINKYAGTAKDIIVCGGGAYNQFLMNKLHDHLADYEVFTSLDFGIEPSAIEAMCFAWLACLRLEEKTGNLPSVTSAEKACVLGGVYRA